MSYSGDRHAGITRGTLNLSSTFRFAIRILGMFGGSCVNKRQNICLNQLLWFVFKH